MKRIFTTLFFFYCILAIIAQRPIPQDKQLKAKVIGASIMPISGNIQYLDLQAVKGVEVAWEWVANGEKPWHYYWNMPNVGLGFQILDLGNPDILGYSISVYPYLSIPILKYKKFAMHYRVGAGGSILTRTWEDCDTEHGVKAATANSNIGSYLNVYLTTGIDAEYRFKNGFSLIAEAGYNHMSNGSVIQPNGGLNMVYGSVGVSYLFKDCSYCKPPPSPYDAMPYDWSLDVSCEVGQRELYYKDNQSYLVGTFHIGATKMLTSWYGLGLGTDVFYDGAFNQQGTRPGLSASEITQQHQHTLFNRYYVQEESFSTKLRAGISICNEFVVGRTTAFFNWGMYYYDGMRNNYTIPHSTHGDKRPMVYAYDIEKEDGWNYIRFGMRYRVFDNFYAQVSVKTHLSKAEFMNVGFAYVLPFKKELDPRGNKRGAHYTPLFYRKEQSFKPGSRMKGERYIDREKEKQRRIKRLKRQREKQVKKEMEAKTKEARKREKEYNKQRK